MFQSWRYNLREAELALQSGSLEEAVRLLTQGDLQQTLPGRRLSVKVADTLARRAQRRLARGERESAWREIDRAERLFGQNERVRNVRRELIDRELKQAEAMLGAGDPSNAVSQLEHLLNRKITDDRARKLMLVARRMNSARALCRRGKYAAAEAQLSSAEALRPDLESIRLQSQTCHESLRRGRALTDQLHRSMAEADWSKAVSLSDELLHLSPENALANDAHRKAWSHLNSSPGGGRDATPYQRWAPTGNAATQLAPCCLSEVDDMVNKHSGSRFLLWVDAVGGYLVCLKDEVVLGQAIPDTNVDIPILGDLSSRHAKIRRQGEQYLIEPFQQVKIDGQILDSVTLLNDGDEIELGPSVRLRFRKPHALSATARLDYVSRHRTQPWADAVLLMAESCVLGPNWHNHVVCRDWPDDVVLYRGDGQMVCRAMDSIEIDGQLCDGRGKITYNSHIAGVDFSMSLEEC